MKEFGIVILKEGHDGCTCVDRYKFTMENLDRVLDTYSPYRIKGDLEDAYDFLINPDRINEPDLYVGQTETRFGTDEEYRLTRI